MRPRSGLDLAAARSGRDAAAARVSSGSDAERAEAEIALEVHDAMIKALE